MMANGRVKQNAKKAEVVMPVCSECSLATWQWKHEHLDLKGNPICLTCPHQKWWIIRGTKEPNCQHFVKGSPHQGKKSS